MPSMPFLTFFSPPGSLFPQRFTFLSALMALLSQKASWRRADPVVARSGANIQPFTWCIRRTHSSPSLYIASRQQGSSLAGQQASSSLDNPVSSVTSLVPSPSSDGSPYRYAFTFGLCGSNTLSPVAILPSPCINNTPNNTCRDKHRTLAHHQYRKVPSTC